MLKALGAAALKDFIGLLKKEPQFFSLDEKAKFEQLDKAFGPAYWEVFKNYLTQVSSEDFLKEVHHALMVLEKSAYPDPDNQFLNVLATFISRYLALCFDQLEISFFFAPMAERKKVLEGLFPGESSLNQTLRDLISGATHQEVGLMAHEALSYLKGIPFVVVQTPLELDPELKRQIRTHILTKHPFSFPEFQVNPQIIGGLRVFVGGQVIDHSWMGKIQALTALSG